MKDGVSFAAQIRAVESSFAKSCRKSKELNIGPGCEGKPVLRLGFLLPRSSSCWPRYTLWVFVLRLLHTLPVWPVEGCFKVRLSHVLH